MFLFVLCCSDYFPISYHSSDWDSLVKVSECVYCVPTKFYLEKQVVGSIWELSFSECWSKLLGSSAPLSTSITKIFVPLLCNFLQS